MLIVLRIHRSFSMFSMLNLIKANETYLVRPNECLVQERYPCPQCSPCLGIHVRKCACSHHMHVVEEHKTMMPRIGALPGADGCRAERASRAQGNVAFNLREILARQPARAPFDFPLPLNKTAFCPQGKSTAPLFLSPSSSRVVCNCTHF